MTNESLKERQSDCKKYGGSNLGALIQEAFRGGGETQHLISNSLGLWAEMLAELAGHKSRTDHPRKIREKMRKQTINEQ